MIYIFLGDKNEEIIDTYLCINSPNKYEYGIQIINERNNVLFIWMYGIIQAFKKLNQDD